MKKVSVVILNFKVADLVISCVKSVQKSDYKDISIIVVDNNSQDGLEGKIKDYKDVEFIQTGKNLGYSGGNNVGIKKALKDGADYVFVLNPDTTITKDTIDILLSRTEQYQADIVGPKIYFENSEQNSSSKKKIWFAGGIFDKANVLGSHKGVNEVDKGQHDKDEEVDFISGAALFVKSEVFKKVGLFDENYFLYYEDSDLCYRAKQAGFKIMYIYQAIVFHGNAKSTGLGSPLQDYYITRNRLLFASKFLPVRTRFALLREAVRNCKIRARRKALFDYLVGNFGKGW